LQSGVASHPDLHANKVGRKGSEFAFANHFSGRATAAKISENKKQASDLKRWQRKPFSPDSICVIWGPWWKSTPWKCTQKNKRVYCRF